MCVSALIPVSERVHKHMDLQGACMCVYQCSDLCEIAAVAGRSLTDDESKSQSSFSLVLS